MGERRSQDVDFQLANGDIFFRDIQEVEDFNQALELHRKVGINTKRLFQTINGQWAEHQAIAAINRSFPGEYVAVPFGLSSYWKLQVLNQGHVTKSSLQTTRKRDAIMKGHMEATTQNGKRPDVLVFQKEVFEELLDSAPTVGSPLFPHVEKPAIEQLQWLQDDNDFLVSAFSFASGAVEVKSSISTNPDPNKEHFKETEKGTQLLLERMQAAGVSLEEQERLVREHASRMYINKNMEFPGASLKARELIELREWQQATSDRDGEIPIVIMQFFSNRGLVVPYQGLPELIKAGVIASDFPFKDEPTKARYKIPESFGWPLQTIEEAEIAVASCRRANGTRHDLETDKVFCGGEWRFPADKEVRESFTQSLRQV